CRRSSISAVSCGTCLVAAEAKVEQNSSRNDWYEARVGFVTDLFFFEVLHDALGRVETERAAPSEHYGVDALYEIAWIEEVCLASTRRPATLRDAADGSLAIREHDRAACQPARKREMPDTDPGYLRDPPGARRWCLAVCRHRENHAAGQSRTDRPS